MAGLAGWSQFASASGDGEGLQTVLIPEHYELLDDGSAVLRLHNGEPLTLNSDQFVVLNDGVLLIVDELAQAALTELPVLGALRTQLMTDISEPVRSSDGSMVADNRSQPIWSGEGDAPRLFEDLDFERYELAQAASEEGDGVSIGLVGAGAGAFVGLALLTSMRTGEAADAAEIEEDSDNTSPPGVDPTPTPAFIPNAAVPESAATTVTGGSGNTVVGVTPLLMVGNGAGQTATFDMSAGGNNIFVAGSSAGASSGSLAYTGGDGSDVLSLGTSLASEDGEVSFDMTAGGNNVLVMQDDTSQRADDFEYRDGPGQDIVAYYGESAFSGSEVVSFDMSAGGKNILISNECGSYEAPISFTGGADRDIILVDEYFMSYSASTIDMSAGGANLLATKNYLGYDDDFIYEGGAQTDTLLLNSYMYGDTEFDMDEGGNNYLVSRHGYGDFRYTGGDGTDTVAIRERSGSDDPYIFDMLAGGNNILSMGKQSTDEGSFTYLGGQGSDILGFATSAARANSTASIEVSLGDDDARDVIAFDGLAGTYATLNLATIEISDFDLSGEDILILPGATSAYANQTGTDVFFEVLGTASSVTKYILTFNDSTLTTGDLTSAMVPGVGLVLGATTVPSDIWVNGLHNDLTSIVATSADSTVGLTPLEDFGGGNDATIDLRAGGNNTVILGDGVAASSSTLEIFGGGGNDDLNLGHEDIAAGNGTLRVDMSAGGNNTLYVGRDAATDGGSIEYTGGSGRDELAFADDLAESGSVYFDMSLGGENTLNFGEDAAAAGGTLTYVGGSGADVMSFSTGAASGGSASFVMTAGGVNVLSMGQSAAQVGVLNYQGGAGSDTLLFSSEMAEKGSATFDMTAGGNNLLIAGESAALSGELDYTGGADTDTLIFGDELGIFSAEVTFDMSAGGDNTLIAGTEAAFDGSTLTYTGGAGRDVLGFGTAMGQGTGTTVMLDLGADNVDDFVFFDGSVGSSSGEVVISNFDAADGDEITLNALTINNVVYAQNGADVDIQNQSGTAIVSFTIEDASATALSANAYTSGTGLVLS